MSFCSQIELKELGLKDFGERVKVSSKASLYGLGNITIGDDSRIDDFCVISAGDGGIEIGKCVHVAIFSSLLGSGKIVLADFSGLSSRVSVYSSSDDYSGAWMTNPTIPSDFRCVKHGDVVLGRHAIVGAGAVILPKVTIGDGVAIGACSLVRSDCEPFCVYAGVPAKKIGIRKRGLLEIEKKFMKFISNNSR